MRSKDKLLFIVAAIIAGLISLFVSSALFNSPAKRNSSVPVVETINSTFPDIKNDSSYNTFLNNKALDPTQPVQIGNSQNPVPFNSR